MDRTCAAAALDGGKERLGGISKQGDRYLRRLLVIGATVVVRHARQHPQKHPWVIRLRETAPPHGKIFLHEISELMAIRASNNAVAWSISGYPKQVPFLIRTGSAPFPAPFEP